MPTSRVRRVVAEGLGAAMLVAAVVGSGMMATSLTSDVALQLLANTLAAGAMLVVLVTVLGPVSGAHFNPAVSLVFAWRGELPWIDLGPYVFAQCAGAVAGTMLAHAMFGAPLLEWGMRARATQQLWFAEVVATFTLVFVILGALRARPEAVPLIVGLVIASAYWFTSSTSFANPAVTLGRAFTTSFAGLRLIDVPMFVMAQIAGALAGAGVAAFLFGRHDAK